MVTLSVDFASLNTNANKLTKLNSRVSGINDRFLRLRRNLDWDVMGEAQLEIKISSLLSQLNSISKMFSDAGTALQNIDNEYTTAQKELKALVGELPLSVNQLSKEEIGWIVGSVVGSSIFPGLGPVFGSIGGWYGGLIDNPINIEGPGQFLGVDSYGKAGLSGPGYEIINESKHSMDAENIYYTRELGIEGHLLKGEVKGEVGLLSGDATVTVGGGSVVGTTEFSLLKDGAFDPSVEIGVDAEAYAIKGEANTQFGNDDYNMHVGGEGYVCVAEASGGIQINEDGVEFGGEVGAAVLKGEAKGGFTLFGITIDATVEGEALAVGAGAGFKAEDDSVELSAKLSALLGAGVKLKISW